VVSRPRYWRGGYRGPTFSAVTITHADGTVDEQPAKPDNVAARAAQQGRLPTPQRPAPEADRPRRVELRPGTLHDLADLGQAVTYREPKPARRPTPREPVHDVAAIRRARRGWDR
jgi:hypothetical protein